MTLQQAEAIILQTGIKIALQHRFAFDTGTILRLENDAMINVFDDGRYYIQGDNKEELIAAFGRVEAPWDPDTWNGQKPSKPAVTEGETRQVPPGQSASGEERLDF
jgi:hypothetical protein